MGPVTTLDTQQMKGRHQLETIPEVIAHLDDFERELHSMTLRIREYRHMLFAAYSAECLDSEHDGLID